MEKWFPIITDRLYLREFKPSDEDDVHEYASDPQVTRLTDWGPNTRAETHRFFTDRLTEQNYWPRTNVDLAIELSSVRKVIGGISLRLIDETGQTAETGWATHRNYWRNGYATEAANALVRVAFEVLRVPRLIATCDARNERSWKLMERIGMRREAELKRDRMQRGEWRDTYVYALERERLTP